MKTITKDQIERMIRTENPWLEPPHEIPAYYKELRPRDYFNLLYPYVADMKVRRSVVLLGPRRVGKTVLIHHVIQELIKNRIDPRCICYISVDHPVYNGLDPEQLLSAFCSMNGLDYTKDTVYALFDEIQYLKDWERYLKNITDRYPAVKCVVTGSAAAALRLKSLESGAGRFTDFLLPPLTFYEYLKLLNEDDIVAITMKEGNQPDFSTTNIPLLNERFIRYINFGGYPEVALSKEIQANPERFVKSDIIDKVLLRDLPSIYGISDIQELNTLFLTLAFNTAQEISLDSLSKSSGLAKNTIKRYIEYLEAAFLIKTVNRVDKTARHFHRANFFKVYLTNPSLWSALFSPVNEDDEAIRPLVETAVFAQWFHSESNPLYYARWDKGEVDIIAIDEKRQKADWAVEVKWGDSHYKSTEELKSLVTFCRANDIRRCMVTSKTITGEKNINNIDVAYTLSSLYSYALGYRIMQGKYSRKPPDQYM